MNRTNRKRNSTQIEVRNARHWRRIARIQFRRAIRYQSLFNMRRHVGENPVALIRRLPLWRRVLGFLRQRWAYAALLIFAALPASAQTLYVAQYQSEGTRTVAAMTAKAQAACWGGGLPCVLVFEPILASYTQGSMPTQGATETWFDYYSLPGWNPTVQFFTSTGVCNQRTGGIRWVIGGGANAQGHIYSPSVGGIAVCNRTADASEAMYMVPAANEGIRFASGYTIGWSSGLPSVAAADVSVSRDPTDVGVVRITAPGATPGLRVAATAFASLATPQNGTMRYCNDCTIANPCASGGTGAIAKRLNGIWVCN